jgi:Putative Actinobacterial Holin-X, holin superfamily III
MAANSYSRSIPEIFTDLVAQLSTLLRKEGQLARAEVSDNIGRAAAGLGLVVGSAVLMIPAFVVLIQAGVAALTDIYAVAPHWSALIVGGSVLVLGVILLLIGVNRLKIEKMMPSKTIHQLQRDASVAKEQMREHHEVHRAA